MDDPCKGDVPRRRGKRRPRRWLYCPACHRRLAQIETHDGRDWLRIGGALSDLARLRCGRCHQVHVYGVPETAPDSLLTAANTSATLSAA